MEVSFLGGAGEVGRSAVLVDDSLLLDYGVLASDPPQYPVRTPEPDAVVASHGHLDHVGAVPALLKGRRRPDVHWTPPTGELTRLLANDTLKLHGGSPRCPFTDEHVSRLGEVERRHGYEEPFAVEAGGTTYEVTLFEAGHIPGSAHVLVDDGETRLLYTGDFHTDDQRLVAGTTARPDADVVICESTYSDVTHDDRADVERRFVASVEETLWEGGTVVVPAFAIGRTQELLLVCAAHDLPCYVEGMGTRVTTMLRHHPGFVRDAKALRRAAGHARVVTGRDGQRRRITDQPTVIVTTSGMLSGGPAMTYVPAIRGNPVNKVTMTGYQVEGTPGRQLLETGTATIDGRPMSVSAQVEQYDFSAHADRDGLRRFLDDYRGARVFITHGDRCERFAESLRTAGFDASAPTLGTTMSV